MKQAEMRKKICPIMSRPNIEPRPTYEYLTEDSEAQHRHGKLKIFEKGEENEYLKSLLEKGWKITFPKSAHSSLQRETEPICRCDAMPGNMECGFEAQ